MEDHLFRVRVLDYTAYLGCRVVMARCRSLLAAGSIL